MKNSNNAYLHSAELIAGADALVIAACAGMGVDSGLPDFRGNEGFWQAYPALAKANLDFMDVADHSHQPARVPGSMFQRYWNCHWVASSIAGY